MTTHVFKTWPMEFQMAWDGFKRHEIRDLPDRDPVNLGDRVLLVEWNPRSEQPTGRVIETLVFYVSYPRHYQPAFSDQPRENPIGKDALVWTFQTLRNITGFTLAHKDVQRLRAEGIIG